MRLLIGTRNPGKLRELLPLFSDALLALGIDDVELVTLAEIDPEGVIPEPDEPYDTYYENAQHKAAHYSRLTGLVTISEDSGLDVHVLPGVLGVYSKRWHPGSDDDRVDHLLFLLNFLPRSARKATYHCSLALHMPNSDRTILAHGTCNVMITEDRRGTNGFSYDPITEYANGRTFGELTMAEKNAISHRGIAVSKIAPRIASVAHAMKLRNAS